PACTPATGSEAPPRHRPGSVSWLCEAVKSCAASRRVSWQGGDRSLVAGREGPMSQDEGFLRAIIEEPGDVGLRLIYADWLEERGDPRGEFIRVQCQLEEVEEDDPRLAELQARQRELLAAHEGEWLGELDGRVWAASCR